MQLVAADQAHNTQHFIITPYYTRYASWDILVAMHDKKEIDAPRARTEGDRLIIDAIGKEWIISHTEDLEKLWAQLDEADFADERIPYWVDLWPSSLGLASWLGRQRHEFAGRYCLDCGCGLGFTALVGSWLGARMLACDYELAALRAVRQSAKLSRVPVPQCVCMDWRNSALIPGSIWRLWASDIIYETRSISPVLQLIRSCLAPGAKAWIAEPGRAIFSQFVDSCYEQRIRIEPVFKIDVEPPMHLEVKTHVTIWELLPD